MERNRVDFHVHYNPEREGSAYEAIELAVDANVTHMALLARSEVSLNFNQFKMYGETKGVKVETGVELHTSLDGEEVGLIGIGFDNTDDIQNWLGKESNKQKSADMANRQLSFLREEGFDFDNLNGNGQLLSNLLTGNVTEKAINFCRIASKIPENADVIRTLQMQNEHGWVSVIGRYGDKPEYADMLVPKFLYEQYFAHGRPGNFSSRCDTRNSMDRIQKSGGVVLYSPEGKFDIDVWNKLKVAGVDGIMAWHGDKMELSFGQVKDIHAEGYLIIGGSDYQRRDWEVGTGKGAMYISERRGRELTSRLESNRQFSRVS